MVVPKKHETAAPVKVRSVHPVVAASLALALNGVALSPTIAFADEVVDTNTDADVQEYDSSDSELSYVTDDSYDGYETTTGEPESSYEYDAIPVEEYDSVIFDTDPVEVETGEEILPADGTNGGATETTDGTQQQSDTARDASDIEQEISDLTKQESYRETMIGEYQDLKDEVKKASDEYESAKEVLETTQAEVLKKYDDVIKEVESGSAEEAALEDLNDAYVDLCKLTLDEDDYNHRKEEGTKIKENAESDIRFLESERETYTDEIDSSYITGLDEYLSDSRSISEAADVYLGEVEATLDGIKEDKSGTQASFDDAKTTLEGLTTGDTKLGKLVSDLVESMNNAISAIAAYDEKFIKLYDLVNPVKYTTAQALDPSYTGSTNAIFYRKDDQSFFCMRSEDNSYRYVDFDYDSYDGDAQTSDYLESIGQPQLSKWSISSVQQEDYAESFFKGGQWYRTVDADGLLGSLDTYISNSKSDINAIKARIDALVATLPTPTPTPEPEDDTDYDDIVTPVISYDITTRDRDRGSSSSDSTPTVTVSTTQTTTQTPATTNTNAATAAATETLTKRVENVDLGIEVDGIGTEDVKVTDAPVLTELMDGYYNVERMPELDRDLLAKNAQDASIESAADIVNYWWYVYIDGEKRTIMDANGNLAEGIDQVVWMTKEDFEKLGLLGDNVVIAQTSGLVVVLTASSTLGVDVLSSNSVDTGTIVPTPDTGSGEGGDASISDAIDNLIPTPETGSVSSRIASYVPQVSNVIDATEATLGTTLAPTGDPMAAEYMLWGLVGVGSLLTGEARRRREH